jgi:hypothetical protein
MLIKNATTVEKNDEIVRAVRNADGLWINSETFREEAKHFRKYKYYCPDPPGSPGYLEYWTEQRKRCRNGYSSGGSTITGDHYYYLNFCPIQKAEESEYTKGLGKKVVDFPDFWDGDYKYYWVREIARNGLLTELVTSVEHIKHVIELPEEEQIKELVALLDGLGLGLKIEPDSLKGGFNLIVGKSRRKGYSYKAGSIASNNYFNRPNSLTIFAAYDNKYLLGKKGIFQKAYDYINFGNEHTAWSAPCDVVNQVSKGNIRNSYTTYNNNGIAIEKGMKSEINSVSCMDNPDAIRGADIYDVFFEESGAFGTPGLLEQTYIATVDTATAGSLKTGLITVFGTSGDMEGGTYDYANMFNKPKVYGFLPMKNTWDANSETNICGYFHPDYWNMEGYMDKQGNSDVEAARSVEIAIRERMIKAGATSSQIKKRMQERPHGPKEAFASTSINLYPTYELQAQLDKVRSLNLQKVKGTPVQLYREGNTVKSKRILDGSASIIDSYYSTPDDIRGCVIIYEEPLENAPRGLYKIGYDPVRQDSGTSLASVLVYKSFHQGSATHSIIVAEWLGRHEVTDDNDRLVELIADYYAHSPIMYENEVTSVKNYFRRIKRLNMLALQPDGVISKNIKKSKVNRIYGCHMVDALKDAGERYIKDWLLNVIDYDEDGTPIKSLDKIWSPRLLEELIAYNRKGNFDMHSSLIMCMIQVQEEYEGTTHEDNKENKNAKDLLDMMQDMYKKY